MLRIFIISSLLLCSVTLIAQGITKIRSYGGAYNDYGAEIIESSDGGYTIIGTTGSFGSGQSNMYLLKIDENLEIEWSTVFGGNNLEWGQSILEVADGYLLLGYTNSFGNGGYDAYLVKCTLQGEQLWQKTYGGNDWDFGYKIIEHQSSFYIAGETWSTDNAAANAWLVEIDSEGNELWSGNFGGPGQDAVFDFIADDDLLIAVGTINNYTPESDVFLLEITSNNDVNEYIISTGDLWSRGHTGILHSNGSLYISGAQESDSLSDYLFLRLDQEFNFLSVSSNAYGGALRDICYDMIEVDNGQIIMAGESKSFTGTVGALLLRVNNLGAFIAAPTHGDFGVEKGRHLMTDSNNQLLMVGETSSYGAGNFDVYIIQFPDNFVTQQYDAEVISHFDSLLTSIDEPQALAEKEVLVYPNPSSGLLFFESGYAWNEVAIFNARGQFIRKINLQHQDNYIDITFLSPGMYILDLHSSTKSYKVKVLIR